MSLKKTSQGTLNFGHILKQIIAGSSKRAEKIAEILDIPPTRLTRIINGHEYVSYGALVRHKWPEILAQHFPQEWKKYRKAFETSSPVVLRSGDAVRPSDEKGFGYVLWLIMGGRDMQLAIAAERLGLKQSNLKGILEQKWGIEGAQLPHWQRVLGESYPKEWERYKMVFLERLRIWNAKRMAEARKTREGRSSRRAAGAFVQSVLKERGDDIEDVLLDVSSPGLKNKAIWQKIIAGDANVSSVHFKKAVEEICRVYHIGDTNLTERHQQHAEQLIKLLI